MKVLIGYDGSDGAGVAVDELQWAGVPEGSQVVVLTAAPVWIEPPEELGGQTITEAAFTDARRHAEISLGRAREVAEEAVAKYREKYPQYKIEADAVADSPAWAIIQRGESWPADLIIVGSHGHTALGRMFLGSTSHRVVTTARCGVRIARKHRDFTGEGMRLLVGTDGSPDSIAAVKTILARKWPKGTQVRVLSATSLDVAAGFSDWMMPPPANWGDWAKRAAEEAAEMLSSGGMNSEATVSMNDPKTALIDMAEGWQADCVFLGASGLTRVERFLLGSVSTSVAMHAKCAVEIAHERKG